MANSSPTESTFGLSEAELSVKYPNRPFNYGRPLAFHDLIHDLFNPLNENKKPAGAPVARRKQGPHGPHHPSPHEQRRNIIEKFIDRWRREVGPDVFPMFRLILPDKDRERAVYGLKEKAIGKLLVRIIKIDKKSEDGQGLLNWKLPGQKPGATATGDFAARCHSVLVKRQLRSRPGDMDIEEVNKLLDKLSIAQKEEAQLPIFETFYRRMNADEMGWLIRIILKEMKVGASEKTFFEIWHPDAPLLFNVSSNLRRVCWELHDPKLRLEAEETDVNLMQCFQPQLAQFQMHSFEKMIARMRPTDDDKEFWIEEKLDGERMQLHMCEDGNMPSGFRFAFWSRKAKDYTYLYGESLNDGESALTRHLKQAFHSGVHNIILDGEMITWDTVLDKMVAFGHLKTAAIESKKNANYEIRPLYVVFDILYLNDKVLTQYTLRDRRRALESAVQPVPRRLEVHPYTVATKVTEIDPKLRAIVAEASEGLVLKNPRSAYRLNQRNDDWMKVKPEYMSEYGEALDCVVVGGYYGSGRRGGSISSFLCGLRVDQNHIDAGADPAQCWSFFKVGGGFAVTDYQAIKEKIGDKWQTYDRKRPPTKYIELGGGPRQHEAPDVWIRPDQSIVISVKAASIHTTDSFRTQLTLRFPRFKALRLDRAWDTALSLRGFAQLRSKVEEQYEKQFTVDESRRNKRRKLTKKELTVAGSVSVKEMSDALQAATLPPGDPTRDLFSGLTFCVLSDCKMPHKYKRSKAQFEAFIKAHGGAITQKMPGPTSNAAQKTIPVSDSRTVKATSIMKLNSHSIIRPLWVFEAAAVAKIDAAHHPLPSSPRYLLPYEPRHILFVAKPDEETIAKAVDQYGDGYAGHIDDVEEMKRVLDMMPADHSSLDDEEADDEKDTVLEELEALDSESRGWLFKGCYMFFDDGACPLSGKAMDVDEEGLGVGNINRAKNYVRFAGGTLASRFEDERVTHVVVSQQVTNDRLSEVRHALGKRKGRLPRLVSEEWVWACWQEGTRLDEERFRPAA